MSGPAEERVNLAVIGAGYWSAQLLRVFAAIPRVAVRYVVDVDPARLENLPAGVHGLRDARAAYDDPALNAVVIATPPAQHFEPARAALRAGKHCWIEKPMALRVADAADLVALARDGRRTLFVDETFLYDPLVQRARDWIARGRLGRLHHLSFERLGLGRVRRDSDIWWNSGAHDLALLRYLVAAPVERISLQRFAFIQPEIADVCVATAQLSGDIVAHFHLSWLSPVRSARLIAVGSEGMLSYEGRFGQRALSFFDYRFADARDAQTGIIPIERFAVGETHAGGPEEPLALAARAFLHAMSTGEPAPSDGARSLEVVKLLAAAESGDRR